MSHLGVAAQQKPLVLQQPHEVVTCRGLGAIWGSFGVLLDPPKWGRLEGGLGEFYLELPWIELTGKGEKGLRVFLEGTGRSGGARSAPRNPEFGEERGVGTLKKPISKMASG